MVYHANPAPFTGRPDQEATEIRVGGEHEHSAPAPVADTVHEERGLEHNGMTPRKLRRG